MMSWKGRSCVLGWLKSPILDLQILLQCGQEVPDGRETWRCWDVSLFFLSAVLRVSCENTTCLRRRLSDIRTPWPAKRRWRCIIIASILDVFVSNRILALVPQSSNWLQRISPGSSDDITSLQYNWCLVLSHTDTRQLWTYPANNDFTCSVNEFMGSTGSIHVFPYVISPDSVKKIIVLTHWCEITSFSRDDMYQWNCTSSDPVRLVSKLVQNSWLQAEHVYSRNTQENTYWWSGTNYEPVWYVLTGSEMVPCLLSSLLPPFFLFKHSMPVCAASMCHLWRYNWASRKRGKNSGL